MVTKEMKMAICEEYKDRNNRVTDIAKKYNIDRTSVIRYAVAMGAEQRRKRKPKTTARICPKCRKTIDIKGTKFCCYCGSDIRSNKEILIERVENAMTMISFLPVNMRDEAQHLFADVIKELENKEK